MRYKPPILRGPIRDPSLADNSVSRERPPIVGVTGTVAIVTQDKVFVFSQALSRPGVVASIECIGFIELFAINVQVFPPDLYCLSWQPDDSFDEIAPGIPRVVEDHDIAALRRMKIICELVYDQILAIV
jgi:hypothetical protein